MIDDRARDVLLDRLQAQFAAQEASFTAQLAALHAKVDRPRRRHRLLLPRRFLPLALVALLVVLTPLATFAASPFNDLTGGVHDANIGLLYDAGITKGCVPNVSYCPTGNVTREEMASFLARTAGLGTNPPVVNAKTAQNADTVGGYAANTLNRVAFSHTALAITVPSSGAYIDLAQVTLTVPGTASQAVAVRGAVSLTNQPSGGYVILFLRQDAAPFSAAVFFPYLTNNNGTGIRPSTDWVFVAPPGTHTYTLVATVSGTVGNLTPYTPILTATTHPFGASGAAGATEIDTTP